MEGDEFLARFLSRAAMLQSRNVEVNDAQLPLEISDDIPGYQVVVLNSGRMHIDSLGE
jgi:hypothetical protein